MRTRSLVAPSLLSTALSVSVLVLAPLATQVRAEAPSRLLVHAGRLVDGGRTSS